MQLSQALRLPSAPCLAFVGAGGKTSAMFLTARELVQNSGQIQAGDREMPSVFVTTTTHLSSSQLLLADHHIRIDDDEDLSGLERSIPHGIVLVTGPRVKGEADRVSGLGSLAFERLLRLAASKGLPLLVEADGARLRPLKAPEDHEPALPGFIEAVVVVAGLSGLGKPLAAEWVHRPERFSELSDLPLGAEISVEALARLLSHPLGGLKGIPPHARRFALLNQAETAGLRSQAEVLAGRLVPPYHAVVTSSLSPQNPSLAQGPEVYSVDEPVAGVILAAGRSARYGKPKQLLNWRGESFIRHVARKAVQAGLGPVIVVTGSSNEEVRAAVQDLDVTAIYNPYWEAGQSTSLKAGLQALPAGVGAAVFLLSDMPQVQIELIRALVKAHSHSMLPIAAPVIGDHRANPVLFDRSTFPELMALEGDQGGRRLFSQPDRYPVAWVPWNDPGILLDVDTPDDYDRLMELE